MKGTYCSEKRLFPIAFRLRDWSVFADRDGILLRQFFSKKPNLFFDCLYGFDKCRVVLAGRIFKAPVVALLAREALTLDVAAHGDCDIDRRKGGKKFAALCLFRVDAVKLFHKTDSIGIDVRFGFGACGIAFKDV